MEKIQTFIFVCTSTTGLSNPDITEICMIACSRAHLLSTKPGDLLRVDQKLVLKFRPRKSIEQEAKSVSGKWFRRKFRILVSLATMNFYFPF